ncbi:cytochrome P450 3A24 [Biomphalaria pfeifferi]|uniref:Cytochrome P450 3A24 n=1 Tax=Biomphalaria pfeifferi TaxID=112525 RepID=A0AAD8B0W0_BIOPF|nr:cytochrome P450 3A24 [Biomphalaria pfeifferi]
MQCKQQISQDSIKQSENNYTLHTAMITLALIGTVVLLEVFAFYKYMTANHGVFKKMGIEHPPTSWFFGNFNLAIKYGVFEAQKIFYNKYKDKKVYGWYDSRKPVMVVRDLDMIKDIFVKNFASFTDRYTLFDFNPPFRDNLLNLRGEHWKHVRNIVTPTFSSGRIKKMTSHIHKNTKVFLENIQQMYETGQEVELRDLSAAFTLDVIASTGFGLEINTLKNPKNKFATEAQKVINPNPVLFTFVLFIPELSKFFSTLGFPIVPQKSMVYFAQVVDQIIEERKRDGLNGKVNDFLDLLMNAEKEEEQMEQRELTRSELHAQALLFIFAGFDTTATVLSFTLFFLAMNPEVLKKAQQEVDAKCGQGLPNYDTAQALTYLDMCINESIRVASPAIFINRRCVQDTYIQGIHIPKDMIILIPICAIHSDPEIYSDPDKFDPERFNSENKATRHPYAHLPFGQGPRNCIGMRLALLELKIALAALLQKFSPVPCSKSVYPIKLSKVQPRAQDGLWVKFEQRMK